MKASEERIICGKARAAAIANSGYTRAAHVKALLTDYEAAGLLDCLGKKCGSYPLCNQGQQGAGAVKIDRQVPLKVTGTAVGI